MRIFAVQLKKEISSYFDNYNVALIFTAYYLLSFFTMIYIGNYFSRDMNPMDAFFEYQPMVLIFIIPALTMKSWSDEEKSGTLELLLTQPIRYVSLVLAKYFAAFFIFLILILSSLIPLGITSQFSIMDQGIVTSCYSGLMLCGMFFCAVGCTISSFNQKSIISYTATIFILFFITQFDLNSASIGQLIIPFEELSFNPNYTAFLIGNITLTNIAFFIIGTILFLWLNCILVENKKFHKSNKKNHFLCFLALLFLIFINIMLSLNTLINKSFDFTDHKIYTLLPQHLTYLEQSKNRIDITLYISQDQRLNSDTQFSVYARYVEKIFKLFHQTSKGIIKVKTVLVPSFSELENKLINSDKISYQEDLIGKKSFIAAEFSDNFGNRTIIKNFTHHRLNLLETDILRIIKSFEIEKQDIAVIADEKNLNDMNAVVTTLKEFYNVHFLGKDALYIPNSNQAVLVIDPKFPSLELLFALDQYILNGGKLMVFSDPDTLNNKSSKALVKFLNNYGIFPHLKNSKKDKIQLSEKLEFSIAHHSSWPQDLEHILVQKFGIINSIKGRTFNSDTILSINKFPIGVISYGNYYSYFVTKASDPILSASAKPGKILFIYDTDILRNSILLLNKNPYNSFYDIPSISDNLLFLLKILDLSLDNNIENSLYYKKFNTNYISIGSLFYNLIEQDYKADEERLTKKINDYEMQKRILLSALSNQFSAKHKSDIAKIDQLIQQTKTDLSQLKNSILTNYKQYILFYIIFLCLVIPALIVLLLCGFQILIKKIKFKKIRRLYNDAQTL